MIIDAFDRAFQRMEKKNWEKIYILIDIHDTILKATYNSEERYEFYPFAEECLRLMTESDKLCLILWSSSYRDKLEEYDKSFCEKGIVFDYINENPEVVNEELTCYDNKLYFNVGIDDKFGFNAETEWEKVYIYLFKELMLKNKKA